MFFSYFTVYTVLKSRQCCSWFWWSPKLRLILWQLSIWNHIIEMRLLESVQSFLLSKSILHKTPSRYFTYIVAILLTLLCFNMGSLTTAPADPLLHLFINGHIFIYLTTIKVVYACNHDSAIWSTSGHIWNTFFLIVYLHTIMWSTCFSLYCSLCGNGLICLNVWHHQKF